ncbi:MAG: hypothetical protein ABSG64_14140 [Solirubrobacteraceae bacterium]
MPTAHVSLSIDLGSDPIHGSLHVGQEPPKPFCGWLELAAAIEALRAASPDEPSDNA